MTNTNLAITPRIYVACLAAYNNGRMHGTWIDLTVNNDCDLISSAIQEMLKASPIANAEEWAIHDSEFLGDTPEFTSIADLIGRADFINEEGEVALALLEHYCGNLEDSISAIQNYMGEFDSELDFAYRHIEDCYEVPNNIFAQYFDYEMFARDLFINDFFSIEIGATIYVFSNY